jgi:hypothetical protein
MSHLLWFLSGKINALLVTSKNYGSISYRIPIGGIVALVVGGVAVLAAAIITFCYLKRKRQSSYQKL